MKVLVWALHVVAIRFAITASSLLLCTLSYSALLIFSKAFFIYVIIYHCYVLSIAVGAVPNSLVFFQRQTGPLATPITLGFQLTAEYEVIWVTPIKIPAAPWAVKLQGDQTPASMWVLENCMAAWPTLQAVFPLKSTSISLKQSKLLKKKITHGIKLSRSCIGEKKKFWKAEPKGGTIKYLMLEFTYPLQLFLNINTLSEINSQLPTSGPQLHFLNFSPSRALTESFSLPPKDLVSLAGNTSSCWEVLCLKRFSKT